MSLWFFIKGAILLGIIAGMLGVIADMITTRLFYVKHDTSQLVANITMLVFAVVGSFVWLTYFRPQ